MKRTMLFAAAGFAALFAASAVAGEAGHKEQMMAKLAHDSSPENVKAVAMKQKMAYCEKNAKNRELQGGAKESYINTCMNRNEAREQYAMVNRGNTQLASSDINRTLHESPSAAGK